MNDEFLRNHIEALASINHPAIMERFVLRNGTRYEPRRKPAGFRLGPIKECFKNSAKLALSRGLDYVEGFAHSGLISLPIYHAWCVDADGGIVDVTWRTPGESYIGVVIPRQDLERELVRTRVYGVLDPGMINVDYIFERDPGLRDEIEALMSERKR